MKSTHLNIVALFICFFCFVPNVFSQDFVLRGVVVERGTSNRMESAQVINKRNGFTTLTSSLGLFEIKASIGDTLLVIKRDMSDAETAVPSAKDLIIYMNRSTTLKEVDIFGQSKKAQLNDVKKDFKNKGSFYQGKPPVLSYIFTPLTAVYELFGRTPRNARRFGKYYDTELKQTQIDGYFNEYLIQNNTPLKGKELEDFMLNYRPDYEKSKNWAEYDAIKYIRDSYKKYADTLNKAKVN